MCIGQIACPDARLLLTRAADSAAAEHRPHLDEHAIVNLPQPQQLHDFPGLQEQVWRGSARSLAGDNLSAGNRVLLSFCLVDTARADDALLPSAADLWVHVIDTADADDKGHFGLRLYIEPVLGLCLPLEPDQILFLQAGKYDNSQPPSCYVQSALAYCHAGLWQLQQHF